MPPPAKNGTTLPQRTLKPAHRRGGEDPRGRTATSVDRNRIATFVKVAEMNSFTRAAAQLGVPKSSVSRSVSGLEADLGVLLLQRTTRELALTEAGRALYQRVRQAMVDLDQAIAEVSDQSQELRGPIRVTAPTDFGEEVLAGFVARFLEQHPCVQIELSLTGRRVNLVEEGFDLAVRAGALTDSTLISRRIGDSNLGIFASESYVERRGRPRSVEDLKNHSCVFMKANAGIIGWQFESPRGPVHAEVSGSLIADNFGFLQRAVRAGIGLGLLPLVDYAGNTRDLVRILPTLHVLGGAVHVVWPSSRYMPARVTAFRDFLVEEMLKRQPEGGGARRK